MFALGSYGSVYISLHGGYIKVDGKYIKNISFGFSNIKNNGCGVIAPYNVLLSKSNRVKFNDVKDGIIMHGDRLLGAMPVEWNVI